MKLDIGSQEYESDEQQALTSTNWQYKSSDELFVTEEFVYQLVEEYEYLNDKIILLQATLQEKTRLILNAQNKIAVLEETVLTLTDELSVAKTRNEELYMLLEEYEEKIRRFSIENTEVSAKQYTCKITPVDIFQVESFIADNQQLLNLSISSPKTPRMKEMLTDLESRLVKEQSKSESENIRLKSEIQQLNAQLLRVMREKEILSKKIGLEVRSESSSVLFSCSSEKEREKENIELDVSIGPVTLFEMIGLFIKRLEASDPDYLQVKFRLLMKNETLISLSNSIVRHVEMEFKSRLNMFCKELGISERESVILVALVDELCNVKRILNESTYRLMKKEGSSGNEKDNYRITNRHRGFFSFIFGR